MQLSDLVGPHRLEAPGRVDVHHPFGEENGIAWGMDGKSYFVFEDPEDGYRSHATDPLVTDAPLYAFGGGEGFMTYRAVTGIINDEILELIDDETGHCWLRVGTDNADDYYPRFMCEWRPMPPKEEISR
jgi:hypothetical protein